MAELSKDNLLRSWKEIASYLGCDVRTCHRWETNRGMPVHRAEGGESKSPVFAYKDELDHWFQRTFKNSNHAAAKNGAALTWLKWIARGAILLALAGLYFHIAGSFARRQPADFRIEGSWLVITDKGHRELWRKDMGVEDLQSTEFYRANFQVMHTDQANILPTLVMKDINGDGDIEVLFALKRINDRTGEGALICYDRSGEKLWRFRAGKELACRDKVFSPDYRIAGFHCHDLDGDGRLETVVESFQAPDWPCQLAVLDASGKMIGEFWNAGYLRDLKYHDLDGDGRQELIVCGVTNEYRGGCLIVFDIRDIRGASPQSGEYVCEGLAPGSMLYYITLPYTDVSEAMGNRVEGLRLLDITENNWIEATYGNGLIFDFDFRLECVQVYWGHGYEYWHGEMVKAGKITSVLDDDYARMLREGIRYWNGSAWTAEPAMSR